MMRRENFTFRMLKLRFASVILKINARLGLMGWKGNVISSTKSFSRQCEFFAPKLMNDDLEMKRFENKSAKGSKNKLLVALNFLNIYNSNVCGSNFTFNDLSQLSIIWKAKFFGCSLFSKCVSWWNDVQLS